MEFNLGFKGLTGHLPNEDRKMDSLHSRSGEMERGR